MELPRLVKADIKVESFYDKEKATMYHVVKKAFNKGFMVIQETAGKPIIVDSTANLKRSRFRQLAHNKELVSIERFDKEKAAKNINQLALVESLIATISSKKPTQLEYSKCLLLTFTDSSFVILYDLIPIGRASRISVDGEFIYYLYPLK